MKGILKHIWQCYPQRAFHSWRVMDQLEGRVATLWCVLGLMMVIMAGLFWGWYTAPRQLTVYVPPDLNQPHFVQAGTVPSTTVYGFAYQLMTALNTWQEVGRSDYPKRLRQYSPYLSAGFYHTLQKDYQQRRQAHALDRQRMMAGTTGFDPARVHPLGPGLWQVDLDLELKESVDGAIVKHVLMRYPIRVRHVQASIQDNPWQLQLAGFQEPPRRIRTLQEASS